jgi:hypothetical protein
MIRFRVPGGIDGPQAAACACPELRRLAGCGPWTVTDDGQGLLLTHGSAVAISAWTPWQTGLGGLMYQLPIDLPDLVIDQWVIRSDHAEPVRLVSGHVVPIVPAFIDGLTITLNGGLGAPASPYGRAVATLIDRVMRGDDVSPTDPQAVAVARQALATGLRMPAELMHAWGLLATGDISRLVEAASAIPKAACGAGNSNAAPPASIPGT